MTAGTEEVENAVPAPRDNPDLLGHDEAERILFEAFRTGRLAHAWLIGGARGIGKATLAYRFARFVLATGKEKPATGKETPVPGKGTESPKAKSPPQGGLFGDTPDSAGEPGEDAHETGLLYVSPGHPVFQRVKSGGHADLMSVERRVDEKSGKQRAEIVVDDVRPIAQFLGLTAAEGGWRVVVIDAADDLNPSAANALLKILEEPPDRALLLLVSHNPGRLLPTIRSRCQRLTLKPLDAATLRAVLRRFRPDLAADEVTGLARLAEGSVGRALILAEEGGVGLYREFIDLISALPELDIKALHAFGDKLARPGREEAFRTFMDLAQGWLYRLMVCLSNEAALRTVPLDEAERVLMGRLAAHGGLGDWLAAWDHVDHIFARAETAYLDKKQVALSLFHALEKATVPA